MREKGRDLTQSFDKSPYTNRKIQNVSRQEQDKSSDIEQQPAFGDRNEAIYYGFSLFRHFLGITFHLFTYFVWLRITDEGSVPEMRIWSIL